MWITILAPAEHTTVSNNAERNKEEIENYQDKLDDGFHVSILWYLWQRGSCFIYLILENSNK